MVQAKQVEPAAPCGGTAAPFSFEDFLDCLDEEDEFNTERERFVNKHVKEDS